MTLINQTRLIAILFSSFCLQVEQSAFAEFQTEMGGKGRYELLSNPPGSLSNSVTLNRLQFLPWIKSTLDENYSIKAEIKTWINLPKPSQPDANSNAALEELAIVAREDLFKATLGLQKVSWGENFGFNPADVVHSRDFREPASFEFSRTKVPLVMANVQLFWDAWDLQAIYVPLPRSEPSTTEYALFRDSEGGFRTGYRFGNLVAQGFYYRHWNRIPIPALNWIDGIPHPILRNDFRLNSYGISANTSLQEWILRGDLVINDREPVFASYTQNPELHRVTYLVLGTDRALWSDVDLGIQYMGQYWDRRIPLQKKIQSHWVGANLQIDIPETLMTAELMTFRGINTNDQWTRARFTWNTTTWWSMGTEGNLIHGEEDSINNTLFSKQKSLLLWTELIF